MDFILVVGQAQVGCRHRARGEIRCYGRWACDPQGMRLAMREFQWALRAPSDCSSYRLWYGWSSLAIKGKGCTTKDVQHERWAAKCWPTVCCVSSGWSLAPSPRGLRAS
eukprot:scaffold90707_cov36-Tisochrysis_lutea.AAC.1